MAAAQRAKAQCKVLPLHDAVQGSNSAPLYCMPTASGSPSAYEGLAKIIGRERPVYGVRVLNIGTDGRLVPFHDLEDFGAEVACALIAHQSGAQFHLLGFSFGGVLAVVVAQNLVARGQRVASVAVIDQPPSWPSFSARQRFFHFMRFVTPWSCRIAVRLWKNRGFRKGYRAAMTATLANKHHFEQEDWYLDMPQDRQGYVKSNTVALHRHRFMHGYRGDIILLRPEERNIHPRSMRSQDDFGWHLATGATVQVRRYPGDHGSIARTSDVRILAQQLMEAWDSCADEERQVSRSTVAVWS